MIVAATEFKALLFAPSLIAVSAYAAYSWLDQRRLKIGWVGKLLEAGTRKRSGVL
jgi:hypothetical protein